MSSPLGLHKDLNLDVEVGYVYIKPAGLDARLYPPLVAGPPLKVPCEGQLGGYLEAFFPVRVRGVQYAPVEGEGELAPGIPLPARIPAVPPSQEVLIVLQHHGESSVAPQVLPHVDPEDNPAPVPGQLDVEGPEPAPEPPRAVAEVAVVPGEGDHVELARLHPRRDLETNADINTCLSIAHRAGYSPPTPNKIEAFLATHQGVTPLNEKKKTTPGAKQ
ncbi:MAG: hypothetical protein ACP5II_04275 [Infirmifilum sp.]